MFSGSTDDGLVKAGTRRTLRVALPHIQSVPKAVSMSPAIAAVPRQFAKATAGRMGLNIYALQVEVPVPDVRLYWYPRLNDNTAHR